MTSERNINAMKTTQDNTGIGYLQINNALNKIVDMSPNITDDDRAEAAKELDLSKRTIARYEKEGTGSNLDTAMKLIKFFRGRIVEREKLLSSSTRVGA